MDKSDTTRNSYFRPEALRHYRGGDRHRGDVLRLPPRWVSWTYRVLVGFAVAAAIFLCVARMSEFASGEAVVRATRRADVRCPTATHVREIAVLPGESVRSGQVLVRLGEGLLVAPFDGVVADVRCFPGEDLPVGRAAISLVARDSEFVLHAALPGFHRPSLKPGLPGIFEPSGYVRASAPVTLATVADEAVGRDAARRYLGEMETVGAQEPGSFVLGTASLAGAGFVSEGRLRPYTEGLRGKVEIRVRSVPILVELVPGLRQFLETRDHEARD